MGDQVPFTELIRWIEGKMERKDGEVLFTLKSRERTGPIGRIARWGAGVTYGYPNPWFLVLGC